MRAVHDEDISCTSWILEWLKTSYDDVISAVDDFFEQWNPSTATPIEEECVPQGAIC